MLQRGCVETAVAYPPAYLLLYLCSHTPPHGGVHTHLGSSTGFPTTHFSCCRPPATHQHHAGRQRAAQPAPHKIDSAAPDHWSLSISIINLLKFGSLFYHHFVACYLLLLKYGRTTHYCCGTPDTSSSPPVRPRQHVSISYTVVTTY